MKVVCPQIHKGLLALEFEFLAFLTMTLGQIEKRWLLGITHVSQSPFLMRSILLHPLYRCLILPFFAISHRRAFFVEALSASSTRRSSRNTSMQSVPSTSIPILQSKYTLVGRSWAGDGTTFIIPELKWMFDCGALVDNGGLKQPTTIFLTHTHSDHIFTLAHFTHRRELAESKKKMKIYLPEKALPFVKSYLTTYNEMVTMERQWQTEESHYELIPVQPNQEFSINQGGKELIIKVIECVHRIDCVGYSIFENQKKLKEEYKSLEGKEIGKLRKSGIEITTDTVLPMICYLGDTTHDVFTTKHPEILKEHSIVVVECSFLQEESLENAERTMHMNWINLKPIVDSYPKTLFVLTHFSLRYGALYLREFFNAHNQQSTHYNIHPMLIESEINENWHAHHGKRNIDNDDENDGERCKSETIESSSSTQPPTCNCFVCQPSSSSS